VRAWRRARFAAAVRLVTQLDEEGLQFVLKNLPAWVKVRRWPPGTLHCHVCEQMQALLPTILLQAR